MGTHLQAADPKNYTIGGVRFFFNRDVDLTVTPKKREGFKDLGNVVTATDEQGVDILDHFTTRSGTRRKDRSLVREITDEILLTLDELAYENIRMFFRAGDVTEVAAAVGVAVNDEIQRLFGFETRILAGYNPGAIVVKDYTDTTTYVLNTDYEVVNIIGGLKGIRRKAGGAIPDNDYVRIDYTKDVRAHKKMMPGTKLEVTGQGIFYAVSDTGNEFTRSIERVQVEAEGAFELNDEDWSQFQLRMKILDNSDAVATEPFGTLEHYGTGTDI